jgi:MFS family permease
VSGLERYARVLRAPQALPLLGAGTVARFPIGINGLAIVLFGREHTGSYATAGALAAVFALSLGLSSPVLGRLIDQRGVRVVVPPLAAGHAAALVALVVLGQTDAPVVALAGAALVAGVCLPPLGAVVRSLWPRILRGVDPGLLPTALAVEGVLIELIFVVGPLLTAVIVAVASPSAALLLSATLVLVGTALFVTRPIVGEIEVSEHAGTHGMLGALRSPGIRTLVLVTVPLGFCFGAMEVALPAFAEDVASRAYAGVLIAVWSAGSAIGGIVYGAVAFTGPPARRYARLALLLPIGYLPLAAATSLGAMLPLALVAGLCIAPTITAGNQLAGDVAPRGAETEAFTWPVTALVGGLAFGTWTGGALAEAADPRVAFLAAAAGAALGALIANVRRRTLERTAVPS